jgi:hypothetical protein
MMCNATPIARTEVIHCRRQFADIVNLALGVLVRVICLPKIHIAPLFWVDSHLKVLPT